jgi:hypothetical protein
LISLPSLSGPSVKTLNRTTIIITTEEQEMAAKSVAFAGKIPFKLTMKAHYIGAQSPPGITIKAH